MQTIEIPLLPYTRWSMSLLLRMCRCPCFWQPLVRCIASEYLIWIFWEMTSGIISICSALRSTVDTCVASVYEVMASFTFFYVNVNSDPEGTSWLSLSTETGLHSVNCAADREDLTGTVLGLVDSPVDVQRQVPWLRQYRISWRFRSCSCSSGSSTRSSLCKGLLLQFAAFFELRPLGRECPFFSPR